MVFETILSYNLALLLYGIRLVLSSRFGRRRYLDCVHPHLRINSLALEFNVST